MCPDAPTHTPSLDPAVLPRPGRLLGIDWGDVRVGLARCDEGQVLASPLGVIVRRRGKRVPMAPILEAARETVGIVVGLPLTPEGGEGASAQAARTLAAAVARQTGLPVLLWDERYSTAAALDLLAERGGRTRGRKGEVDAMAASVLLQHLLEVRRAGDA